ncbi:MAG: hypothetical protein CL959_01585 [Euryarchaeota archaeon]|mgnify:CR=1 FL=1|nr:hypothetical protein [Euryarchaeota archaeon]
MHDVEAPVDKHGFTLKPPISDQEVILRCLANAPAGLDAKQVRRLIEQMSGRSPPFPAAEP